MAERKVISKAESRRRTVALVRWLMARVERAYANRLPITPHREEEISALFELFVSEADAARLAPEVKAVFKKGCIDGMQFDWLVQHVEEVLKKVE